MYKTNGPTVRLVTIGVSCLVLLAGCSQDDDTNAASAPVASSTSVAPATTTTTTTTAATTTVVAEVVERAFNGRPVPDAPTSAEEAASMFISVQDGLRAPGSTQDDWADLGHAEQLIVRTMLRQPEWNETFLAALPDDYARIAELHLLARTELALLHSGAPASERVPGWRIVDPEPMDVLVAHYQRASEETGIDWEVLAGVNLIETVMGRIDGVSSAGALGPMQFLPTTWPEVSQGGDVLDPADAIPGAATSCSAVASTTFAPGCGVTTTPTITGTPCWPTRNCCNSMSERYAAFITGRSTWVRPKARCGYPSASKNSNPVARPIT